MNPRDWKIRTKILATLVPAMILSIVAIGATFFYSFNALHKDYKALLEDKTFALSESIRQIMNQNLKMFPLNGMIWMNTYLHGVVNNNTDISYAFITNKSLVVLYHSDEDITGDQLDKPAYENIRYDIFFKRLMFSVGSHYEIIVPIVQSDQIIGTIHIGIRKELIDSKIFDMLTVSISILLLTWGATLLLIYGLLRRQIIQPITVLAEKTTYISQHRDLNQKIVAESRDEIGVLSTAFNAMIESLRQYYTDLASQVQRRTLELQNRNEQLNNEILERQRLEASLRVAKEDAEAASHAKSEFLARMSHEIRTPMNAILGMSELLGETTLNHDQRDYIHTLQGSGELLLSVINDILDFSKIEAGQIKLEAILFDLVDLVEGVVRIMVPRAHEKQLDLAFRIAPGIYPHLQGDPTRLRQILINLLGNAIKFTVHGEVVIEVTRVSDPEDDGEILRFSVRDTGIGIAPEQQEAVFESFSQSDVSITRKYGGSGLGLAICKQLVELMGGQIGLNSRLGQGSEFFFTAVFARAACVPVSKRIPETEVWQTLKNQRALIVDDTAANRLLLHDYLTLWGAQVSMAENGVRALEEIVRAEQQDHAYNLILMDIQMPEMDGVHAVRLIRDRYPAPPPMIIILTSSELPDHRSQLEALGIQGYLAKPVRRADLFETVLAAQSKAPAAVEPTSIRVVFPALPAARILLVEDIAANRKVIQKFLQDSPATLIEAVNGLEAVAKATAEPFDLILMDVEMPAMDGLEAVRRIRAWERETGTPPVPIVTLTAHVFSEHRQQCRAAGCNAFLAKPIRKGELVQVLSELLPPPPLAPTPSHRTLPSVEKHPGRSTKRTGINEQLPFIQVRVSAFLHDLLPEFLNELSGARADMQRAMTNDDFGDLYRLAHGYKGAAGSYELPALERMLLELEQAALNADEVAAAACFVEIDDYLCRLEIEYI